MGQTFCHLNCIGYLSSFLPSQWILDYKSSGSSSLVVVNDVNFYWISICCSHLLHRMLPGPWASRAKDAASAQDGA